MAAHGARDATGSESQGRSPRPVRPVTSAAPLGSFKSASSDLGERLPLDRSDPLVCNQGLESFLISPRQQSTYQLSEGRGLMGSPRPRFAGPCALASRVRACGGL
jgi:hypothetical protein